jgi:hypothetical protein
MAGVLKRQDKVLQLWGVYVLLALVYSSRLNKSLVIVDELSGTRS